METTEATDLLLCNMGLISLRHARRIFANNVFYPFNNLTMYETVENMCNHFCMIWEATGFSYSHIQFKAWVDATVVVKSW